ncbi:MAG: YdjC-like protein, partial [Deltaproteobacteria bacterium]|nr:YdjC-like protein [Deltaproteobacteria bacterium]
MIVSEKVDMRRCAATSFISGKKFIITQKMKKLIINADDLGAEEGRNSGIFEAVRAGAVK